MPDPIGAVGQKPAVQGTQGVKSQQGVAAARAEGAPAERETRPPGDGAEISEEANGPEENGDNPLLKGLQENDEAKDAKDPQEEKVKELQKQIEEAQEELQKALQSGDEKAIEAAAGRLSGLLDELQGVLGGGGQQGGGGAQPPAGGGGAPPAGGGGAPPMGGGGAPPMGGGQPPMGGGGAPPMGGGGAPPMGGGGQPPMGGGGAPPVGGGGQPPVNNNAGGVSDTQIPPPELSGNDQKLAQFIEKQLDGSPAGGKGLGAHFVAAGRKNEVDPLALVAIAKHETGFGKLGVGLNKMLGVGAYDSNPNGKTPYDGAINQIYSGAKTFANLRAKGGSNAGDSLGVQLSAVNRAGWATDQGWHNKVAGHYNNIVARA